MTADFGLPPLQKLIDTGTAWKLEGHVGRQAMAAIENGEAILGPQGHRDYWGNYVPARDEVMPGTKGSIGYALDTLDRREALGEDVEVARARIEALAEGP